MILNRETKVSTPPDATESKSTIATASVIDAGPADRLAAALDRDDPPFRDGDPLPHAWHWLYVPNFARASELSSDGRGGADRLLPDFEGKARMWAGCSFTFHAPILIGETVTRASHVAAMKQMTGRSGALTLASVAHELSCATGSLVTERQDLVLRDLKTYAGSETGERAALTPTWHREITPDEVLLFTFSALTHNTHRIHYDWPYATKTEGYPGLVVHGPLTCILLLDLIRRYAPSHKLTSFECRAIRPLFCGRSIRVCGTPQNGGSLEVWAQDDQGHVAMRGTGRFAATGV